MDSMSLAVEDRGTEPCTSPLNTDERISDRVRWRSSTALVAALGLLLLLLSAAPAVAGPTIETQHEEHSAPPDGFTCVFAEDVVSLKGGRDPVFTAVQFSTTEYYEPATTGLSYNAGTGVQGESVCVGVKSAAALSAMSPAPANPFTVTASMTIEMIVNQNDVVVGWDKLKFVTQYR